MSFLTPPPGGRADHVGLEDALRAASAELQQAGVTIGDLAAALFATALERAGRGADVRQPVLRALLAAVAQGATTASASGERDAHAVLDLTALIAPPELPAGRHTTLAEGVDALLLAQRELARGGAGTRAPLCDAGGADLLILVAQAFAFSGAVSLEALIAWHADPRTGAGLDALCLAAHDPRASERWPVLLAWAQAAIARLGPSSSSDNDDADGSHDDGMAGDADVELEADEGGVPRARCGLRGPFAELVARAPTTWHPSDARVALYVQLGTSRETVVVLDGLVDDNLRAALLDFVTAPGWDHSRGPPPASWSRDTADGDGLPRSWGLRPARMGELKSLPAAREVQSRLCALYPAYDIAHMPAVRARSAADGGRSEAVCAQFVGNATVTGDTYRWHVDADPAALEPEACGGLGGYVNGATGRPLFVSLLVYLNAEWRASWDGETLFRDPDRSTGVLVQPLPGRAILMVQDVLHRASAPSPSAPAPRYSLVWKLLFIPPEGADDPPTLVRAEWGEPARV